MPQLKVDDHVIMDIPDDVSHFLKGYSNGEMVVFSTELTSKPISSRQQVSEFLVTLQMSFGREFKTTNTKS